MIMVTAAAKIERKIRIFKRNLNELKPEHMVRKFLIFGSTHILKDPQFYELKEEISKFCKVHPSEVIMVGSAKLGFTIKSNEPFRHFAETSDVDIAIVSNALFDKIWLDVYKYKKVNGPWSDYKQFKNYLFKGWIRPDKLPDSEYFKLKEDWFEFFRELTSSRIYGDYPISAGLYKSWFWLEDYQTQAIKEIASIGRII